MEDIKISVVLNTYKRLNHIDEQIISVREQTIKPIEIIIWNNSEQDLPIDITSYGIHITVFNSSKNMGVWARFFAVYNCIGEYVAIFDDDTIPGNMWFQNCINCMKDKMGLYGTTGYRFSNISYYHNLIGIGWREGGCYDSIEEVDIIGHAWFFKKEWMKYFVNDLPDLNKFKLAGEDLHLSYTFKKYGGIRSYIAIHPPNDRNLWGSNKGMQYGTESVALYLLPDSRQRFEDAYN